MSLQDKEQGDGRTRDVACVCAHVRVGDKSKNEARTVTKIHLDWGGEASKAAGYTRVCPTACHLRRRGTTAAHTCAGRLGGNKTVSDRDHEHALVSS